MEKYAVTISRQFGSLGRSVAQELSELLGIVFLDRDIVEETAKRMNAPVSLISREEEGVGSRFSYRAYPLGIGIPSVKDEIFQVQKSIIQDFARKESCIIVGRCGSFCLKDHPRLLNIFIYAPYEKRLENCVERLGMTEKTAKKTLSEVDAARESYHKIYIPGYKTPFSGSDLCINSSTYGVKGTAEIIADVVCRKFNVKLKQ